jgi:2-oxoglutarate ferredoxin oxidoreductase subunit beta
MNKTTYKKADFVNDTEIRWCPGCGDYAILAALQRILPELGLPPERHVFVSGIGCAGRLPYYMNAYGFHTIHGRATAVATGLKTTRDDLCVWVITGDGDALSIGANHLIHCLRRNVNVKILLMNNQVYGLTKGQFSPTSQKGQVTKTSPHGVTNQPLNPLALALGAGASFVARAVDCNIFNNGAFDEFALKANRAENTILLQKGQALRFGAEQQWMLALHEEQLHRANFSDNENYRHDPSSFIAAMRLAHLTFPDYPVPLGVYYQQPRDIFDLKSEVKKTTADLPALFRAKASWKQG